MNDNCGDLHLAVILVLYKPTSMYSSDVGMQVFQTVQARTIVVIIFKGINLINKRS